MWGEVKGRRAIITKMRYFIFISLGLRLSPTCIRHLKERDQEKRIKLTNGFAETEAAVALSPLLVQVSHAVDIMQAAICGYLLAQSMLYYLQW